MGFEWDEAKNRKNYEKHGLRFDDVVEMFHSKGVVLYRTYYVGNERRYSFLGLAKNFIVILTAVTERRGNIRIISARIASQKERIFYYGNTTYKP